MVKEAEALHKEEQAGSLSDITEGIHHPLHLGGSPHRHRTVLTVKTSVTHTGAYAQKTAFIIYVPYFEQLRVEIESRLNVMSIQSKGAYITYIPYLQFFPKEFVKTLLVCLGSYIF